MPERVSNPPGTKARLLVADAPSLRYWQLPTPSPLTTRLYRLPQSTAVAFYFSIISRSIQKTSALLTSLNRYRPLWEPCPELVSVLGTFMTQRETKEVLAKVPSPGKEDTVSSDVMDVQRSQTVYSSTPGGLTASWCVGTQYTRL